MRHLWLLVLVSGLAASLGLYDHLLGLHSRVIEDEIALRSDSVFGDIRTALSRYRETTSAAGAFLSGEMAMHSYMEKEEAQGFAKALMDVYPDELVAITILPPTGFGEVLRERRKGIATEPSVPKEWLASLKPEASDIRAYNKGGVTLLQTAHATCVKVACGYALLDWNPAVSFESTAAAKHETALEVLVEMEQGGHTISIWGHRPPARDAETPAWKEAFNLGNARFVVRTWPTPQFYKQISSSPPFWVLIMGIALSLLAALIVRNQTRYGARLRTEVVERTRELVAEREALVASELKHRRLVDNAPIGIFIQQDGIIRFANASGMSMLGIRKDEDVVGKAVIDFVNERDRPKVANLSRKPRRRGGDTLPVEARLLRADDSELWAEVHSAPAEYEGKAAVQLMVVNISARKKAEEELTWLAYYDKLTGLPNRRLFMDRLSRAMTLARREKHRLSLILLDPRNLSLINDSLGRDAGDAVLKEIGNRLKQTLRISDTVAPLYGDYTAAHVDGDEFGILLPETDAHGTMHVVQRISECLGKPYGYDGQEVKVVFSFGITEFTQNVKDANVLVKHAGTALSNAKENDNAIGFFSKEMESEAKHRLRLENDLSKALENGEFSLYFQPQLALVEQTGSPSPSSRGGNPVTHGDVIGVECLIRWRHPELGLVSPAEFIPVAEDTGLIKPITHWVLEQACHQAIAWEKDGIRPERISVNISAVQLMQKGLEGEILSCIRDTGAKPEWVEIEITETAVMHEPETAISIMRELADAGIYIAIDDFGTGYSSLAYLKRLSADWLKIDIAFIRDLPDDEDDAAIVRSTIAMAHELDIRTIAEGVETEAQLEFLRGEGCDAVQGFLFSKPLTVEDMDAYLRKMRK